MLEQFLQITRTERVGGIMEGEYEVTIKTKDMHLYLHIQYMSVSVDRWVHSCKYSCCDFIVKSVK